MRTPLLDWRSVTRRAILQCNAMASARVRFVLAVLSTLAAFGGAEWVVRARGGTPWVTPAAREGEPAIHEFDPELGWHNKQGVYRVAPYTHRAPPTCVTIWSGGRRATSPQCPEPGSRARRVVVVGCSYTQGWAISDDETYSWRLQERFPEAEFFNYGTAGFGTLQSLIALERHYRDAGDADVVLFGLSSVHAERNLGEATWLRTLAFGAARQHVWAPWADLDEHGDLRRHSLVRYPSLPWHESSALVALAERAYANWRHPARESERFETTWKLVLALRDCAQAHGSTFVVAALGWSPGIQPYCRELERAGIPFVTCEPTFSPRLFVRGEGHPNGKMNEIWAEWMAPLVRDALAQR